MKSKVSLIMLAGLIAVSGSLFAGANRQAGSSAGGETNLKAVFASHQLTKDITTMQWLKDFQRAAGVSVEWEQASAGWGEKKAALFASGDIPDLLFNATATSDYAVYSGLFEELAPLIEANAPNVKKMFAEDPKLRFFVTQLDGKIYSLPAYFYRDVPVVGPMFINKAWLDRAGKQVPTTWAELKDVLIAFRDQDVNGNGDRNDEIPLDSLPMGGSFSFTALLGSLGVPLSSYYGNGYFVEDGKVKNWYVDERYKVFISFLRELYAENLINKEMVTQDYSQYQSLARGNGDTAKVGVSWGWTLGDRFGDQLAPQYVVMAPLKYTAASPAPFYSYDLDGLVYGNANAVALSARSRNKAAAMRFVDVFYDPVNSAQVMWGGINDVDKGIRQNADGSYAVLPPHDPSMNAGVWKWTNSWADNGAFYIPKSFKITIDDDQLAAVDSRRPYQEQLNLYDERTNVYPSTFLKFSDDDTRTLAMIETNVGQFTAQWAQWMSGQGNIDADWNVYVKSINDAGLPQALAIRQRAYDSYIQSR
jgi:putative aldouronate transport system substrate-binding protein